MGVAVSLERWQPIDTAPNDSTLIVIWDAGRGRPYIIRADDLCYRPLANYLDDPRTGPPQCPRPKPPSSETCTTTS